MLDQLFENFRKASESAMRMQQDALKNWVQGWPSTIPNPLGASDWGPIARKRWMEVALDVLNKQRQALDASYKSGIEVIEQGLRLAESSSADDYRRVAENLWRKFSESYRSQSEMQFADFVKWVEESFASAQRKPS